jgi:membrane fusion protein
MVLSSPMPTVNTIKPTGPERQLALTSQKANATTYTLFRPESIEARRMVWLGRPAVALGLPAALSSIASVLMMAATTALVALGSYSRTIELHGLVLPSSGLIQVTSPAPGWVQSMSVRDGQFVAAEELLYIINTDTANSSGSTQQQVLQALVSERTLLQDQIARNIELRGRQDAALQQKIENLKAQAQQLKSELAMHEDFVQRVTKNFSDFIEFQQRRIASINETLSQQGNWMRTKDEHERRKSDLLGVQAQLIDAESRLATSDLQIDNEVDAMRVKIAELDQQVATTETRRSIEIHAPGAGNVTATAVRPGQTIPSGARMLTIIPENGKMQAELLAPSSAIAFLRRGERVLLRYSAFPYQRFGEHPGVVTEVSRAALHPEELKALMPALPPSDQSKTFYRVIVTPDRPDVMISGRAEPLQASMQVDASVRLESRPIYQWLVQPLYDLRGI